MNFNGCFFLSGGVEKDIIDPLILLARNAKYFQSSIKDYEVDEYNLDSDVSELCINTSGAAYILPSGVKIVIPNEINCDMDKIHCSVSRKSNKFKLNPTDQLLSPIVELTPNGSKFTKSLQISIPYHYTACDKQTREIVMRVTTAYTNGLLKYEDLNSELINTKKEDAYSFSGEVVSFVTHFSPFAVISRLKEDHVVVKNEQPTEIVSSVDSSTTLFFPRRSVENRADVTITVLKIDDADVKNILTYGHCPVSNVLQVCVSPENTVFEKPVTVFLALPKSLISKPYNKKMLRLLKSSSESEDWQDITTEVELRYETKNVFFQIRSFSNFCLVGKDLEIDDLSKVIRRTITYEVRFLAMQQTPNPSLVLAQCVRRDLVEKRINQLRERKYYGNDPSTAVHDFVEGQHFEIEAIEDIKVKSSDKEKKLDEYFHCQHDPDASGFRRFYIEPRKAASRTNHGFISFLKVRETVNHAPENNRYIDEVPITLESATELSEVTKSEYDIFRKLSCELASKIGADWQQLARCLEMEQYDIDRFRINNPNNLREQIFAMLYEWFGMHAEDSKWLTTLVKALRKAGRNDQANNVEVMYKEEKKKLETEKNDES